MNKSKNFSGELIIKQLLKLIPPSAISRSSKKHYSDRYYKRFKTYDHLAKMLYGTRGGVSSLRELSTILLACEGRIVHLNIKYFPRRSTLSDANKKRSSAVFASIYYGLFDHYRRFLSDSSALSLPAKYLKIFESSTISLFSYILKGVGRNPINGKGKGGIKMHTMINALEDVPCLVRFTSAATHGHTFLKDLNLEKGSFVVFDKAYNDYSQFAEWIDNDIYFDTRQKNNARYTNIEELDLSDTTSDAILRDELIRVKKNKKDVELRRVAYWYTDINKVYEFISNNFLISPDKIAAIYKHRWQIETMFKRLKQNFPLKYFLGDNQNAIEIQIRCGLIIQLLMLVVQRKTKRRWAYSNMVSMVRFHLMTYIDLFKFLENPDGEWQELTTKPPDEQFSFFDATPSY